MMEARPARQTGRVNVAEALSGSDLWADALFASMLQGSAEPAPDQVRQAIAMAVDKFGSQGCADRVAQEFGDHPETAVARMRWARSVADDLARRSVI